MTVCCMFIILLGCKFLHTAQSQTTCPCKEQLETLCGPVYVSCPDRPRIPELFLYLYKDNEQIFKVWHKGNKIETFTNHSGVTYEDKDNKFIITELNGSIIGTYYCELQKSYPPPYKTIQSTSIQAVEGHICKSNQNSTNNRDSPSHGFVWIWTAVVILLIIYSTVVTIIALTSWVKLRKTESHSDYMNTKPRAPRERRKKKGVQNPVPKYF